MVAALQKRKLNMFSGEKASFVKESFVKQGRGANACQYARYHQLAFKRTEVLP